MAKYRAEQLEFQEAVIIQTRRGKMANAVARALDRFDGATLEDKHHVLVEMTRHAIGLMEKPEAVDQPAEPENAAV